MRRVLRAISDIFHDRSDFDIIERSRVFLVVSGVILAAGFLSLGFRGLNLGIDFEGGTAWQVEVEAGRPDAGDVREELAGVGEGNAKITVLGDRGLRVQSKTTAQDDVAEVTALLADYAGAEPGDVSLQTVGPTFGEAVTEQAVRALVIFLIAVVVYLALRFEVKMAGAALVALFHDLGITVGVYSLTGFEVTPATVIAILTILGYSLYDTVVVFDKIRENVVGIGGGGARTYSGMVNRSLNEVLMRSVNTSLTTLVPVASLLVVGSWVLGAVGIRDFALALFVGLLAGTYSSIFTAAPILAWWKEREPRYRALRERVVARQGAVRGREERPAAPKPSPEPTPDVGRSEPVATGTDVEAEEPVPTPDTGRVPPPDSRRPQPPGGDGELRPRGRKPRRRKRR